MKERKHYKFTINTQAAGKNLFHSLFTQDYTQNSQNSEWLACLLPLFWKTQVKKHPTI